MVFGHVNLFRCAVSSLSYHDAVDLAEAVRSSSKGGTAVIDLTDTNETTTAALARLIVLRRKLRRSGGDLRLVHLHGLARRLYDVNRLTHALPCAS